MNFEKKIIIFILISVALIFALYFFITKPAFLEMIRLAKKIEDQRTELEELYQRGKNLSQVKDELKEIENKQTILNSVFLSENEELNFITTLEKLSADHNIKQEISLKNKQAFENNYQIIPVRLSLQASFTDLLNYFRALEKLDFYFNINSLSITSLPKSIEKDEMLNAIIEANTYWSKKTN